MSNPGPRWAQELAASFPPGWAMTTIGELGDLISGSTPPRSNHERYFDGEIPWVKTGDLTNTDVVDTEEYVTDLAVKECRCTIHPPGTVLVAMYGGFQQIGRTGLLRVSAATNQAITAIRLFDDSPVSSEFLQAWLNHMKRAWRRIAGSSRKDPNITKSNIAAFPVPIPPPTMSKAVDVAAVNFDLGREQLDKMLKAKRIFKRGLMQQLLTGQKRFPEYRGHPWHSSRLAEHVAVVTRRNVDHLTLVLTASGEHGLVDQRRYFNRSVAGADLTKYYLPKRGEFAYNRSAMNGYPYGATKRLDEHEEGALSTLYLCFGISDPRLDSDYLKHVFESGVLNRQLRPIVRVGARAHGLLNVTDDDFLSISIPFPVLDEQRRIAEVLNALDREIDLLTAQRAKVEDYKRGLLSKLLSGEIPVPA